MIRVIVNGAHGKMGQWTGQAISKDARFELVGELGRDDDLAQAIKDQQAEVVVDFTAASEGLNNAQVILESGARGVMGTSGFLPEHIKSLKTLCEQKQLGMIIAPNFSIGAILMMHFAQIAATHMPSAEIIEYHHDKKQESPSGTALKTAEMIATARRHSQTLEKGHELITGARGAAHQDISVHAIRLPGIIADQSVIFGSLGETLTIEHRTTSREAFMPGVLLACEQVMQLYTLVFGLEQLIL